MADGYWSRRVGRRVGRRAPKCAGAVVVAALPAVDSGSKNRPSGSIGAAGLGRHTTGTGAVSVLRPAFAREGQWIDT